MLNVEIDGLPMNSLLKNSFGRRHSIARASVLALLGGSLMIQPPASLAVNRVLGGESGISVNARRVSIAPTAQDENLRWAAAKSALESGDDRTAMVELEQLRLTNPSWATSRDVDFLLMGCSLRLGQYAMAWEASQRWMAAQPEALRSTADNVLPWTERKAMLGQAYLTQIQAAYQLALEAPDLGGQMQWLTRAEAVCNEFARLQPGDPFRPSLQYHSRLIALQQEIRREETDERIARLKRLAADFLETANQSPAQGGGAEWRFKSLYYSAVVSEMAGDLSAAWTLWADLLRDSTVPTDVRRSSLLAVADSHLNQWFVKSPKTSHDAATEDLTLAEQPLALHEARDRFHQLQTEFPDFERARVAFNYGTCLRLLGEHAAAVEQFEKISWPPDSQADPGATALAWQAQFNLARSQFSLGRTEAALQAIDRSLQHLNHATETAGGQAVLLRMRLAQREGDWKTVQALAKQHAAWLNGLPDQAAEVDYLAAVAQFQAVAEAEKSTGASRLAEIAQSSGHPFANQAKFHLIPWQLQSATAARHLTARLDLDREILPDLRPRVVAAAQAATELLDSAELSVAEFPANPALWLPDWRERREQRRQVQLWQATAWFKLQEHARAAQAYAALRADFPDDENVPQWTILQAISIAQSPPAENIAGPTSTPTNLASALELLPESRLLTWAPDLRGYGWFIRGELQRLKPDAPQALLAYEKALESFALPSDQIMALGEVIQIYQTQEQFAEILRFTERWSPACSGSSLAFLTLQRGIAHYNLKDFAAAEVEFSRAQDIATTLAPDDLDEARRLRELLADAVFNRGMMLHRLARAADAKALWDNFLADVRHGETRDLVTQRLTELLPDWRGTAGDSPGASQVAETSGSTTIPTGSLEELLALAERQFEQKQWPDAVQTLGHLSQQASEDRRHDRILYLWGWALREQNAADEAKLAWEKLIALHIASPWIARAQFHLGELAYQAGDFEGAASRFQSSRTVATETQIRRSSLYMEAWADLNRDLFESAGNKFQMLTTVDADSDPDHPLVLEAHAMVGQCEYRAQRWSAAVQAFQAAAPQLDRLRAVKPDLYFQSCLNAGRAALAAEQPGQAVGWLTRCVAFEAADGDGGEVTPTLQAEAKLLLATALRLTNDSASAQSHWQELALRPDQLGLRALAELAEFAKMQGDETTARRYYQAAANGAFGHDLAADAVELKSRALLEVGLSFLRTANQQADSAVRAEHLRQAKTWLARAQLQNDSVAVSQEAEQQLQRLGAAR
jgi:tetratricopeptide (TPR) repeat protein